MVERTPSGAVKTSARRAAERAGHTMPGGGSFPINDAADLRNAKHDVGRARNPTAARRWINKRAKALGEPGLGESKEGGGDERKTRHRKMYEHPRSQAHIKD